jgi:hypothetical protein
MSVRLGNALFNQPGLTLLAAGLVLAALFWRLPVFRPSPWLAPMTLLITLLAYVLTVAIYYWSPVPVAEPEQLKALRKLRAGIEEQLRLHADATASRQVLSGALRRLDQEMIPSVERLLRRHALLRRDLQRFESGEIPSPDQQRLQQLVQLRDRQEQAVESVGQQVANAYASLASPPTPPSGPSSSSRPRPISPPSSTKAPPSTEPSNNGPALGATANHGCSRTASFKIHVLMLERELWHTNSGAYVGP